MVGRREEQQGIASRDAGKRDERIPCLYGQLRQQDIDMVDARRLQRSRDRCGRAADNIYVPELPIRFGPRRCARWTRWQCGCQTLRIPLLLTATYRPPAGACRGILCERVLVNSGEIWRCADDRGESDRFRGGVAVLWHHERTDRWREFPLLGASRLDERGGGRGHGMPGVCRLHERFRLRPGVGKQLHLYTSKLRCWSAARLAVGGFRARHRQGRQCRRR